MFDRLQKGEQALLIQPYLGSSAPTDLLEEFVELARSAGARVVATITARMQRPNPALLIGQGKLEEVKLSAQASDADLILVNHALSPVQERNLESFLQRRVVDRTGLILDIFAQRARSHEGKLQVELAQLRHLATRLVRGWTHLERQRGGSIGLRGPGETQLETDRRLLQQRVQQLQKRLDRVEMQRAQMRRARLRQQIPRIALVGYTNAGKSTLFNALTHANAYAADQLFATLDPTVRHIALAGGSAALADTVGFIRDLPHELIAAFRSTLSEARDADLLLHVIDAADPLHTERIAQVDSVLHAIGAGEIPQLLVFNKIDCLDNAADRHESSDSGASDLLLRRDRIWIAAKTALGLERLLAVVAQHLHIGHVRGTLRLDLAAGRLRAQLYALESVVAEQADETGWSLEVDLPRPELQRLAATDDGAPLRSLLAASDAPDSETFDPDHSFG